MWLVFAESRYVYIYTFNGNKFVLNQTINPSYSTIYSVDLTNDHIMLAIATSSRVYIYNYNGRAFTREQTISPGLTYYTRMSWTEDHQYLTFAESYSTKMAYVYNYTGGSYQLI